MVKITYKKICPSCGKLFTTTNLWDMTCKHNGNYKNIKNTCGYIYYNSIGGKARSILHLAVKSGEIIRQKCYCGKYGIAHHEDYSKPKDVIWLCRSHHKLRHSFIEKRKVGLI